MTQVTYLNKLINGCMYKLSFVRLFFANLAKNAFLKDTEYVLFDLYVTVHSIKQLFTEVRLAK